MERSEATTQPGQLIGGAASLGDAIRLFDNGAAIDAFTVNASGTWLRGETLTGAGANAIQAVDTSPAGNTGSNNTVIYTLGAASLPGTTPPVPTETCGAPSVSITSAGGLTRQPAFTVSGRATSESIVALFEGGTPVSHAVAAPDGSWTLGLTLAESVNVLSATDSTPAGTVPGNAIAAILDTTPPNVAFGPPPQLTGTAAVLTGTASDASGIKGVETFDGAADLGAAQVGADGRWTFSHDFGQNSYGHLAAVATDAAGNVANAAAPFAFDTVPSGHSIGAVRTFDAGGAVTSVVTASADGGVGAETAANGDDTATSTGYGSGQSLFSIGGDVMTGNGCRETFVFQPAMGHARITDFVMAGAGHDTLSLSHRDFDNIAQVLNDTMMNHGAAVIHVSPDDTIRLVGVTKAQLAQHRGDFAFTG